MNQMRMNSRLDFLEDGQDESDEDEGASSN